MKSFPTTFADELMPIVPDMLDPRGAVAVQKLNDRGYDLVAGLTINYAEQLPIVSDDPEILEYCPKDPTAKRFGTLESTEAWLQKHGGRAAYLLLNKEIKGENGNPRLDGYGWSGHEPDEEKYTGQPVTTAFRLTRTGRSLGLGKAFVKGVISATHALNTNDGIGLESWGSNPAVGTCYVPLGLILKNTRADVRPTLQPDTTDEDTRKSGAPVIRGGMVSDTRLYMAHPQELFA